MMRDWSSSSPPGDHARHGMAATAHAGPLGPRHGRRSRRLRCHRPVHGPAPCLVRTSPTVPATPAWPGFVTQVALVIVVSALPYWLDSQGELDALTGADLRRRGTDGGGAADNG